MSAPDSSREIDPHQSASNAQDSAVAAPSTCIALYARRTPGHDQRVRHALQMLRSAADRHAGRIVQASSLGVEGMVITDLIARHALPVLISTLDTGTLHAQTLALIRRIEVRYGIRIDRFGPHPEAVARFVNARGPLAMRESVESRRACCALRKLEPMQRLLAGHDAWITGLRREQSENRSDVPFHEKDGDGRDKYYPLADWSLADVWHYVHVHEVPYNPLHDAHYPSIGCQPCTRPVAPGEDFRSGRWWWESGTTRECGLHSRPQTVRA